MTMKAGAIAKVERSRGTVGKEPGEGGGGGLQRRKCRKGEKKKKPQREQRRKEKRNDVEGVELLRKSKMTGWMEERGRRKVRWWVGCKGALSSDSDHGSSAAAAAVALHSISTDLGKCSVACRGASFPEFVAIFAHHGKNKISDGYLVWQQETRARRNRHPPCRRTGCRSLPTPSPPAHAPPILRRMQKNASAFFSEGCNLHDKRGRVQ